VRNSEQTAAHCLGQSDLSAEEATGCKCLPIEMVMNMEDPRYKIVAMKMESLRCRSELDAVVLEIEDPRCQNLHNRAVLEIEDSRCKCEGVEVEDPRCKDMRNW